MNTVLIVEDDLMMADMLEEILVEEGFSVCGIAQSPRRALELAEQHRPQLAVVDVQLLDGYGTDLAPELIQRFQTAVLYTTGNSDSVTRAAGLACLPKPFRLRDAARALRYLAGLASGSSVLPPVPDGMLMLQGR